jgi:hypothetical protein
MVTTREAFERVALVWRQGLAHCGDQDDLPAVPRLAGEHVAEHVRSGDGLAHRHHGREALGSYDSSAGEGSSDSLHGLGKGRHGLSFGLAK